MEELGLVGQRDGLAAEGVQLDVGVQGHGG
jgi:hypothetical protein